MLPDDTWVATAEGQVTALPLRFGDPRAAPCCSLRLALETGLASPGDCFLEKTTTN